MLSCLWLFATPWIAACQASLSFTISQSLLKVMSDWVNDVFQPSFDLKIISLSLIVFPLLKGSFFFCSISHTVAKMLFIPYDTSCICKNQTSQNYSLLMYTSCTCYRNNYILSYCLFFCLLNESIMSTEVKKKSGSCRGCFYFIWMIETYRIRTEFGMFELQVGEPLVYVLERK